MAGRNVAPTRFSLFERFVPRRVIKHQTELFPNQPDLL